MTIREWFHQLFNFVSIIRDLKTQVSHKDGALGVLADRFREQDAAISTLSHALVYITTPPPVEVEQPVVVREVFRRPTYTQVVRQYERQNSARFRAIDEAVARKAAETSR